MDISKFLKSLIMSFLASIAVTIMVWFFLYTLHVDYIMYLAALLGMYIFAGYGVNRLVEDEIIENNASRFILAIVCIVIYSMAFMYIMPLVFGAGVFPHPLDLTRYGIGLDVALTNEIILSVFGLIVLVLNYRDYAR